MNYSKVKTAACTYLGFRRALDKNSLALLGDCFEELLRIHRFRHIEKFFEKPLDFLQKRPYTDFLAGTSGYFLCAMTLGTEVERRMNRLMQTDMARAVVFDACASALFEELSDEYEQRLGEKVTYRFCPGYGGSSVEDLKPLFAALKPEKIGMQLLPSGLMAPQKSMAGVVGIGKAREKDCGDCILLEQCQFRKEGGRCYGTEKT